MGDNTLIADASDIPPEQSRDGWTGLSFADDYKGISQAIESGDWISGAVAGIGASLNVASVVIDPFSSLLAMGIEWAMEQVEPLKEALDWLTGDPETVETHAITWDNIADELFAIGDELQARLEDDLDGWQGSAVRVSLEVVNLLRCGAPWFTEWCVSCLVGTAKRGRSSSDVWQKNNERPLETA